MPGLIRIYLLLLVFPFAVQALEWRDGHDFVYNLDGDGSLRSGVAGAFAGMNQLRINGNRYTGARAELDAANQRLITTPHVLSASGLTIQREVWVSPKDNLVRYQEIVENPGATEQKVVLEVFGNLGTGNPSTITLQQDGFYIADDGDRGAPAIVHYHNHPELKLVPVVTQDNRALYVRYPEFTLPAKGRARLVHFIAQTADAGQAVVVANRVRANEEALFEHLDTVARSEMKNFISLVAIPDRDFSAAPTLLVGESRIGLLNSQSPLSHARANQHAVPYAVELRANETITAHLAASFDGYLVLYADAAGKTLLARNDDLAPGNPNARLGYTPRQATTVYFEVNGYTPADQGSFSLEILAGSVNNPPLAMPIEVEPAKAIAPATIQFTDHSQDSDGVIIERCWDFGDGELPTCASGNTTSHRYGEAGRYTVTLTLRDQSGASTARTARVAIAAERSGITLPTGSEINGELVTTDTHASLRPASLSDRYLIPSAPAGEELVIEMRAGTINPYLYLFDSHGQLLRQDNDSGGGTTARIRFQPSSQMDLVLEATSFRSQELGDYQLSVRPAGMESFDAELDTLAAQEDLMRHFFLFRLPESFEPMIVRWNFGDGTQLNSSNAVVSHDYAAGGDFTVTVTASDSLGRTASGETSLRVGAAESISGQFRAAPLFGDQPLKVFFNSEASGATDLVHEWDFGDGTVATDRDPSHTYREPGTYPVILRVTSPLTGKTASATSTVVVIDRDRPAVAVAGEIRARPQVILAGFDPIQVDLTDTIINVFALVRPGEKTIQSVLVRQNGGGTLTAMQHTATLANGLQRYEAPIPFTSGGFPVVKLGDLFGDQDHQFVIQALDEDTQFQNFPNLEFSDHTVTAARPTSRHATPRTQGGTRRAGPQVLGGGFQTPLTQVPATAVEILALVRPGVAPLQAVELRINNATAARFHHHGDLPNGDVLYRAVFTFPGGVVDPMVLGNLWGTGADQFTIRATDREDRTHRFPELSFGNYPVR